MRNFGDDGRLQKTILRQPGAQFWPGFERKSATITGKKPDISCCFS
jgi:hypothetical protein